MRFVELPILWDNSDGEDFSLDNTEPDFIYVNADMIFSVSDSADAPGCSVITEPSGRGFLVPLTTAEVLAKLAERKEV